METRSIAMRTADKHEPFQPQRSDKRIRDALRKAAGNGLETIMPKVCDPQGEPEVRLHNYLGTIEPGLAAMAATEDGWEMCVFTTDKARQNPINKLGGFEAAGNASLESYWECVGQALAMTAALLESDLPVFLRVSNGSDEGVLVLAGKDMSWKLKTEFGERATIGEVFGEAWALAREGMDLSERKYLLTMPDDGGIAGLDLGSFSNVLRHPDMIVACNFSVSDPVAIRPNSSGFIGDEIRKLENDEVAFYSDLPHAFRIPNGGRAEVLSPFGDNLSLMAERDPSMMRMASGTFIEIKLRARERDALELLPFTSDYNGFKGTRKGFAEIFSKRFGMRGLNLSEGKARTNSVLTPIAQTMGVDVGRHCTVIPMNSGYLNYWVDMPPTEETAEFVRGALRTRTHSDMLGDPGYISLGLEPDLIMLDAAKVNLKDARAQFILKSLGRKGSPAWLVDALDFIPNFVENIHPDVQKEIYEELGMGAVDMEGISAVRSICRQRRTIRDAEDLVWTLRMDEQLPDSIKGRKESIEDWLFRFAGSMYHRMFGLLTQKAMDATARSL